MGKCEGFNKTYPFTTEDISGFIPQLDVKDKSIFTVGSSSDQALNAILLGASEVTLFDIDEHTKEFFCIKKQIILSSSLDEVYEKVININNVEFSSDLFCENDIRKMNLYMRDEESFNKLKERLNNFRVKIIQGDLLHMDNTKLNDKFDLMLLSNVLQYLTVSEDEKIEDKVYDIFSSLDIYLKSPGFIQLFYLYGSLYPKGFINILRKFEEANMEVEKVKCDNSRDSIILIKKH